MAREITVKLYQYDELSEDAQAKAREWYLQDYPFYDWYEFAFDYIREMADCLGLDIECRMKDNGTEKTRWSPIIHFDLNRRHIEYKATYTYNKEWITNIKQEFGKNAFTAGNDVSLFLYDWKQKILALQKPAFYGLRLDIDCHRWVNVDVTDLYDREVTQEQVRQSEELVELFNDFALDVLQKEYDYLISEENIAENIRINEYEFLEDGTIA